MQITAAVLRDRTGRYEIEDVTLADPEPEQILVHIVGVGHCHTDLLARAARSTKALPLVVGHEGSGIVQTVGANTDGIAVGDHVVLSYDSCRRCANCLSGHGSLDRARPQNVPSSENSTRATSDCSSDARCGPKPYPRLSAGLTRCYRGTRPLGSPPRGRIALNPNALSSRRTVLALRVRSESKVR
jgi:NADPH:quinone reductase-like Zn-dependent oxidoreductase